MSKQGKLGSNYTEMTSVWQSEYWMSVKSRSLKVTFWVLWPGMCQKVKKSKKLNSDRVISAQWNCQTSKRISKLGKSGWNYPEMSSFWQSEHWMSVNSRSRKAIIWVLWTCLCQKYINRLRTRSYRPNEIVKRVNECQNQGNQGRITQKWHRFDSQIIGSRA